MSVLPTAFEKLNHENWSSWKINVEAVLGEKELWHYVVQELVAKTEDQKGFDPKEKRA